MMQANKSADYSQSTEEQLFLAGPRSRWKEFQFSIRVWLEFITGFRAFHFLGPCVTVFGSARYLEGHPYYTMTKNMGYALAKLGFTVMTGGGPGLMEAANRGAKEAGGRSVGCNITLDKEQKHNVYLDKWVQLHYFFVRKVLLSKYSFAFVVMPGGYGTLDEFFEAVTLIQTRKMRDFPVVIMGIDYHKELMQHIESMEKSTTISMDDKNIFLFTDDVKQAIDFIEKNSVQKFKLRKSYPIKPSFILGEDS